MRKGGSLRRSRSVTAFFGGLPLGGGRFRDRIWDSLASAGGTVLGGPGGGFAARDSAAAPRCVVLEKSCRSGGGSSLGRFGFCIVSLLAAAPFL